ncbi:hypothetical protein FACS1894208_10160 [Clostridia bacterium]|nr:hypothetical protein FACS1894208_10160 [Clostridia bacterium]
MKKKMLIIGFAAAILLFIAAIIAVKCTPKTPEVSPSPSISALPSVSSAPSQSPIPREDIDIDLPDFARPNGSDTSLNDIENPQMGDLDGNGNIWVEGFGWIPYDDTPTKQEDSSTPQPGHTDMGVIVGF